MYVFSETMHPMYQARDVHFWPLCKHLITFTMPQDLKMFGVVLNACDRGKQWEVSLSLLTQMHISSIRPGQIACNSVAAWSKYGQVTRATKSAGWHNHRVIQIKHINWTWTEQVFPDEIGKVKTFDGKTWFSWHVIWEDRSNICGAFPKLAQGLGASSSHRSKDHVYSWARIAGRHLGPFLWASVVPSWLFWKVTIGYNHILSLPPGCSLR